MGYKYKIHKYKETVYFVAFTKQVPCCLMFSSSQFSLFTKHFGLILQKKKAFLEQLSAFLVKLLEAHLLQF